jgi:aminoglycoside/choline kinase family phosphotransferase
MVLPQGNPGILDFQDAVIGPVTYDLASLLRDCYVVWPPARVEQWARAYWQRLHEAHRVDVSWEVFRKWFDLMGMQRHLKAAGIFTRLQQRDGKDGYIKDIPRTLGYVMQVSKAYPEFAVFAGFLAGRVLPAFAEAAA